MWKSNKAMLTTIVSVVVHPSRYTETGSDLMVGGVLGVFLRRCLPGTWHQVEKMSVVLIQDREGGKTSQATSWHCCWSWEVVSHLLLPVICLFSSLHELIAPRSSRRRCTSFVEIPALMVHTCFEGYRCCLYLHRPWSFQEEEPRHFLTRECRLELHECSNGPSPNPAC